METWPEKTEIPEIWENDEDKEFSERELRNRNFSWALQNLRGKTFFNKSTNRNISISRDGLGEWKTVTKTRDQALSVKILDDLLRTAAYWKEEPPKKSDPNITKVIYFRQRCKINGNDYRAIITIKVYESQNYHKYYHHYLDDYFHEP